MIRDEVGNNEPTYKESEKIKNTLEAIHDWNSVAMDIDSVFVSTDVYGNSVIKFISGEGKSVCLWMNGNNKIRSITNY
jgi:hypothetical protein